MTQPTLSTLPRSDGVCAGMVSRGTTLTSLWLDWELQWSYLLTVLPDPTGQPPGAAPHLAPALPGYTDEEVPDEVPLGITMPPPDPAGGALYELHSALAQAHSTCLVPLPSLTLPWTLTLTLLALPKCHGEVWPCLCS